MTIPPLSSSEDESARSQPSDRRADALSVGLDVEPSAPVCRLDRDTGQPAWAQIVDLFNRYGLKGPPTKLRDELVVHLMWARYGEALDAATTPSDPSTAWRGIEGLNPLWTETPTSTGKLCGSTALMSDAIGAAMETAKALMGSKHAFSPEYIGMACAQDAINVIDKALFPQKRGPALPLPGAPS